MGAQRTVPGLLTHSEGKVVQERPDIPPNLRPGPGVDAGGCEGPVLGCGVVGATF